jgi:hypothetical protein
LLLLLLRGRLWLLLLFKAKAMTAGSDSRRGGEGGDTSPSRPRSKVGLDLLLCRLALLVRRGKSLLLLLGVTRATTLLLSKLLCLSIRLIEPLPLLGKGRRGAATVLLAMVVGAAALDRGLGGEEGSLLGLGNQLLLKLLGLLMDL